MARREDEYDDNEERPRRRRRDDDDEEDEDRPRARRRREYDEDEYEDRPRRRPRRRERAGLDGMFLDTSMVALVLFGLICGGIALILSIIELAIGKDPEAKRRATIVLIIGAVMQVVFVVLWLISAAARARRF